MNSSLNDRFMFNKTKNRNKKHFCKCCLQCFSNEKVLIEHREDCLVITRKQNVKLKSSTISFKNYFKQIPVPFKIYADFKCIFKKVDIIECDSDSSYTKNYHDLIPCGFAYKVACIDNRFSKKVILHRGKDTVFKFVGSILKEYDYCRG